MQKNYLLFALLFLFPHLIHAQKNGINKEKYRISIKKAIDKIEIDGKLNEQSWIQADRTADFLNKWPTDQGKPPLQTEIRLTYDDTYIYVAAKCIEDNPNHIIQTLKRDDQIWGSDGLAVMLDPVNQQTNGFVFFTNPLGVQTEGLVTGNSDDEGMSRDWDNKWFVETTQEENGTWYMEMAIPFKTLRYDASLSEWGINFLRCDVGNNMYSTWAFIPLQLNGTDLGYMGSLVWDNPPKKTNSNVSIIPYITGDVAQDYEDGADGSPVLGYAAGLDAKVAITSSLNLDLTINPDFSQIEVDQQQTNLTRFNLFFPERRTFFLENSDIFSDFGSPILRPFFSRRIGLDDDGNAIPILFGARLSGNATESLRIGAMSVQTNKTETTAGQNYSVASFQQRLLKRSSLSGMVINRQAFTDGSFDQSDYTRNLSTEFNYSNESGTFGTWATYHGSFTPEKYNDNFYANTGLFFNNRKWNILLDIATTGENYIADAGFVMRLDNYDAVRDTSIRIGFNHIYNNISYSIFPKKEDSPINFMKIQVENFATWLMDGKNNLLSSDLGMMFFFKNTQWLKVGGAITSENLPFEINFTGDDYENIPAGWYSYANANFFYMSNQRKRFNFEVGGSYGQFYNGTLTNIGGTLKYRKQPWGNFQVAFERNILTFPEKYGEAKLWLVGPRIGINFSKNLFWTTFIQYNTQAENFNINSRLQWRYSPMSDLFFVYTDNYETVHFGPKSRAFVVKFNYWLTL